MDKHKQVVVPENYREDVKNFEAFLRTHVKPSLPKWYQEGVIPRIFFQHMAESEWLGFDSTGKTFLEQPSLKQTLFVESLSKLSPGVAVAFGVHTSLGTNGLVLFGNEEQKNIHLDSAFRGETLMCLGNTELMAGSDVANVACRAEKVEGGWVINGSKAYVTNGAISDLVLITAVSDPEAGRSSRISMFIVDLSADGDDGKGGQPVGRRSVWGGFRHL